jgi:hypothetical protein
MSTDKDGIMSIHNACTFRTECRNNAKQLMASRKANRILRKQVESQQAKIDELMLEYCPDDMTTEQIENWGNNQVASI